MSVRVHVRDGFPSRVWLGGPDIQRPIPVSLHTGDGEILASISDDVPIHGVGATFTDALTDLRAALTDHLRTLTATDDLTDDLKAQREYLRAHLA